MKNLKFTIGQQADIFDENIFFFFCVCIEFMRKCNELAISQLGHLFGGISNRFTVVFTG